MEPSHDTPLRHRRRRLSAESAAALIAEWEASGLSAGAFAEKRAVAPQTLYRWRDRLSRREHGEPVLCRVATSAVSACGPVVESNGGVRVLMPVSFTDDQLRSVVRVLAGC